MASAREENPYEDGGGGFGKFRKRPFRRTQTTPYDRPPTALRNPNRTNGWFSKLVDPAQKLITSSAHRLFSSVFRKRLPPPSSETVQEVTDNRPKETTFEEQAANESSGMQQAVVSESGVQINHSDGDGLTELEKLLKQKTFTRSEINHLTALLHSRTVDSPAVEERKGKEVASSDLMPSREQKEDYPKTPALENGIVNNFVSTPYVTSNVPMEDVASPAELAKAFMWSRPSKVSPSMLGIRGPPREDPTILKGQHFAQKSPIMSIVPRATDTTLARVHENGFVTPRSRGRSAICSMARTPYSRVHPAPKLKEVGAAVEGEPSSSAHYALDSGSKQGALKRRSSVLDIDIGSFGPIRRIRHKSNLLSSKALTLPHSSSPLSISRSGVDTDGTQQPSSSIQKPIPLGEFGRSHTKLSAENNDSMPNSSIPPLPSKSSEMASKILQQLDKMVSPKEKSSELRLPTVGDKSPTKLSSSMLRGKALRSLETVDSSKFLDNMRDNELDGTPGNFSASGQKPKSKIDKVENGHLKLASPSEGLVPTVTDANAAVSSKQVASTGKSGDSFLTKPDSSHPPQKKRAFHMSAHEDYLEVDDDVFPNKPVSPSSISGKETMGFTAVAEKITSVTEAPVQDMPPNPSLVMAPKSFTMDPKPLARTADGPIVDEKGYVPTSIKSSIPDHTFKPSTGAVTVEISGSEKSTSLNGSAANPTLFNFPNKVAPSTELTGGDAASKEYTKSGPIFGLEKVVSSKEPGGEAPLFNFGTKKADNVPQVPFTFSSTAGDSAGFKFGVSSDSKPKPSISSTTAVGAVDSMSKVPESDANDSKTNVVTAFSARPSEQTVSSAASTSLLTSPTNIFNLGNSSNQNNGTAASSPALSSPFAPVATNSFTSQNIFSSSSLAASSSSISPSASLSTISITSGTPTLIASINSSSSTQAVSSSPTTSFFKFGSTPSPSTTLPVSSAPEPVETKSRQDAGIGNLVSTSFGSSSAAVGSTGSGILGFSSSAVTASNSQSQGSVFGATSGSAPSTLAPPSTTGGFATSTQSQPVTFGSSASSPLFGLSGSSPFSSGSSLFSSSSPATSIFNSGTTSGQSTAASSSEAIPVNSNSGTGSSLFGVSSWQPSKSPFSSSFGSSSSSTSGFSFGASTPSVGSTSSPMVFGSSNAASTPQFSFNSAAATSNMQPAFGSPSPFTFGSAPVNNNNDQMSMEDSMAEDTVQATPPTTPVFGQQPTPTQPGFVFGGSNPTGASTFHFGSQQTIPPFQASGSLEFNAGGSFSLGTGGGDKSGRKFVKVKHKQRKK